VSRRKRKVPKQAAGRWPHRLAWVLACAVFPLIWVGGLVTTYSAGMAVPDWPSTYGYWIYLPWRLWVAAWDLFLEHGHRTLAQVVGLITIALAVAVWKTDRRKWMRWLGVAAVAGVVLQGTIGGLRVLGDEVLLAKVHGCTAPLFFAFCASLVILTSPRWQRPEGPKPHAGVRWLHVLSLGAVVGVYALIVLGAQLRHSPPDAEPAWAVLWVWLKLIAAAVVAIGVVGLLVFVLRRGRDEPMIVRRAKLFAGLLLLQLLLGAGAWVTNYGFPAWFRNYFWTINYAPVQEGPLQVWTTTAHAAIGSLNLVAALSLMLWSRRWWRSSKKVKV